MEELYMKEQGEGKGKEEPKGKDKGQEKGKEEGTGSSSKDVAEGF